MTIEVTNALSSSKAILAYLAAEFPACFSLSGAAKPLKIGLFEDLVAQLPNHPQLSKTRLRSALRHYTSSWRYLRALKEGAQRVDLFGEPCGVIDAEQAAHAMQQLQQSKAQQAAQQKPSKPAAPAAGTASSAPAGAAKAAATARQKKAQRPAAATKRPTAQQKKAAPIAPQVLSQAQLKLGQAVQIKLGKQYHRGQITEIDRNDLQVQLHNGLTVKVQYDAVYQYLQESSS